MTRNDEYLETIERCTITQVECYHGNCKECDIAEEQNADYNKERLNDICDFSKSHKGIGLNKHNTMLCGNTLSEYDEYFDEGRIDISNYKKMAFVSVEMITKYWPHLCMCMTNTHQYKQPKHYLYLDRTWPLFAVFDDCVYMAAPKLVDGIEDVE